MSAGDSNFVLDDPPHDALIAPPPSRTSYRESSQSDDFLTGWEGAEENTAVVEEDEEHDYDMRSESGNESEASHMSQPYKQTQKSTKAKFKPQHDAVSFFYFDTS
jgi:hypothetical protein